MVKELTSAQREQAIKALQSKGVGSICPMCGNKHFALVDGYFSHAIQTDLERVSLGGSGIPTIPIICSKCGFVSQHALGVLGLLPKEEKNDKKK